MAFINVGEKRQANLVRPAWVMKFLRPAITPGRAPFMYIPSSYIEANTSDYSPVK
jgi:hypothetical protein